MALLLNFIEYKVHNDLGGCGDYQADNGIQHGTPGSGYIITIAPGRDEAEASIYDHDDSHDADDPTQHIDDRLDYAIQTDTSVRVRSTASIAAQSLAGITFRRSRRKCHWRHGTGQTYENR